MKKQTSLFLLGITWVTAISFMLFKPEPGWYDYHMSYNEHWYSQTLKGNITDNVMPPGYTWTGYLFHNMGISAVLSLRLVSLVSFAFLFHVVWKIYGERKAILLASLPYIALWSTRAQTDMLFCALVFSGLFISLNTKTNKKHLISGLVSGLSTFVKPTGFIAILSRKSISYILGFLLGIIPFIIWLINHQDSIKFHATDSTLLGDSIRIIWALVVGLGLSWIILIKSKDILINAMLIGYLLFALIKAPMGHEYYLLPVFIGSILLLDTTSKKYWFIIGVNSIIGFALVFLLNNFKP